MNHIIMCSAPFENKVDDSYEEEYKVASKITKVHLFDVMNLDAFKLPQAENQDLVYHGWMMPPAYYEKFYDRCKSFGYNLINSPEQYHACHHFDKWYPMIEGLTPLSLIVEKGDLRPMIDAVMEFMRKNDCGVILKDYVKSLKHDWLEACYIPQGSTPLHISKVVINFVSQKERFQDFQGNMVVRKYVDLQIIGEHAISKMPLSKEFRSFVMNGSVIFTSNYWDQGSYTGELPPKSLIEEIANKVYLQSQSNLFTVDVSQLADSSWTCIEVGDGQVSAFPEQEDKEKFFKLLSGDVSESGAD